MMAARPNLLMKRRPPSKSRTQPKNPIPMTEFILPMVKIMGPGTALPVANKEVSTSSNKSLFDGTTPESSVQMPLLSVEPITAKELRKDFIVILCDMVTTLRTQLHGPKRPPESTAPPKTRRIDFVLRETTVAMPGTRERRPPKRSEPQIDCSFKS